MTDQHFSRARRALLLGGLSLALGWRCTEVFAQGFTRGRYADSGMPYAAFDSLRTRTLDVGGGVIRIGFEAGEFDLPETRILQWVRDSAEAVAIYYGRFPVSQLRLLIVPVDGWGVRSGTAYGHGGAAIKVRLGMETAEHHLLNDWVLVHEMVHLAFPTMNRRHHWIEEGLATYVEGVARAQAGQLRAQQVWGGLVDGMPNGLPQAGDEGLDNTPTWGRTYWGGALFCLLADVEIRRRSGNRKGLPDGLRAILAAGGSMEVYWPIAKALGVADRAIGVPVLSELYDDMKDRPVPVDLPGLWRRLGVQRRRGAVAFANDAPLAAVRRAITAAPRLS